MKLLLQVLLKPSNPNLDPELLPVLLPFTLLDHLLVMGKPKLILMFVGKLAPVLELAKTLSLLLLTLILLAYMLVDQPQLAPELHLLRTLSFGQLYLHLGDLKQSLPLVRTPDNQELEDLKLDDLHRISIWDWKRRWNWNGIFHRLCYGLSNGRGN